MAQKNPKNTTEILIPSVFKWQVGERVYHQQELSAYNMMSVLATLTGLVQRIFVTNPELIARIVDENKEIQSLSYADVSSISILLLRESPDVLVSLFEFGLVREDGNETTFEDVQYLKKYFHFRDVARLLTTFFEQNKEELIAFWEQMKENFPVLARLERDVPEIRVTASQG